MGLVIRYLLGPWLCRQLAQAETGEPIGSLSQEEQADAVSLQLTRIAAALLLWYAPILVIPAALVWTAIAARTNRKELR